MKSFILLSLLVFSSVSFAADCGVDDGGPVLIREVREIPR